MNSNKHPENDSIVPISVDDALLARLADLSVHTRTPVENMLPLIFARISREEFEQMLKENGSAENTASS